MVSVRLIFRAKEMGRRASTRLKNAVKSIVKFLRARFRVIDAIWPRPPSKPHWVDRAALKAGRIPGFCVVCCRPATFRINDENLRENVICDLCGSFNRQRQLTVVLLQRLGRAGITSGLTRLPQGIRVWNMEAKRALHDHLARHLGATYVSSEYLDPSLRSGEVRGGVLHVDAQKTHFPEGSLDVILSSDVLEHVPGPEQAIKETHRILRRGGLHVFTVPFYQHRFTSERRAVLDDSGCVQHIMPPIHHVDPVRPDGVLVFNIFAPQLLCDLEFAGFDAALYRVHDPVHGILGDNGLVIVAQKL